MFEKLSWFVCVGARDHECAGVMEGAGADPMCYSSSTEILRKIENRKRPSTQAVRTTGSPSLVKKKNKTKQNEMNVLISMQALSASGMFTRWFKKVVKTKVEKRLIKKKERNIERRLKSNKKVAFD